jgi:hypothetical protein
MTDPAEQVEVVNAIVPGMNQDFWGSIVSAQFESDLSNLSQTHVSVCRVP